jgi:hypothetical protein
MGFLSSIVKGVKNIFKGVAKVVKKVVKGVKKFASSKLGKVLIASAAIYFGGVGLELWGAGAGSTTTAAATQLASSTIPTAAAGSAATAAELGTLASSGLTGASAGTLATGMGNLAVTGAGAGVGVGAGTAAGSTGLMSQIAKGASSAAKYAAANPAVTLAGGQIASSLFAPSQAQTAEEMERVRQQNSNVAGVNYDGSGNPINLSLSQRAQQGDLQAPTYNNSYVPSGG